MMGGAQTQVWGRVKLVHDFTNEGAKCHECAYELNTQFHQQVLETQKLTKNIYTTNKTTKDQLSTYVSGNGLWLQH